MMKTPERHVKVAVRLEKDEDDYPPVDWEDLWAIGLGDGTFQIDSVPFYAPGISSGDIVSAVRQEDTLVFVSVVAPQGHSTARVIMYDKNLTQQVRNELAALGCSTELSNVPTFFSIDVPPKVAFAPIANLLESYASAGKLDYEESILRHDY